jgi:hypothetical protein
MLRLDRLKCVLKDASPYKTNCNLNNTVHTFVFGYMQCSASFNVNQTMLKLNYFKNLVASTVQSVLL